MRRQRPVILLEFNELSPALMDRFIGQGKLPGFARLRSESEVWTTDAEEPQEQLEPWIQWITVHTGLSYAEHGVFRLGDAHKLDKKRLWDLASDAGHRVWVCGSMNVHYRQPIDGFVLPDAWTTGVTPHPLEHFEPYYRFVRTHIQEYTNDHVPLNMKDYARFMAFMATHGLSLDTAYAISRQLVEERRQPARWKRAAILDRLQWDVFRHAFQRLQPALSTFFLNSTAHLQHAYWRNLDPHEFERKPTPEEQLIYGGAIEFGFRAMDALVQECLDLVGDQATIVFATALGQQPCKKYEKTGGKRFYRPRDMEQLLAFAGVEGARSAPVMSEQFHLYFRDEGAAETAEGRLRALRVGDRAAMFVERKENEVFAGCTIFDDLPQEAVLTGGDGQQAPFYDLLYQADVTKSGMHHPDGMLWIRRPGGGHRVHREKVSIRRIAPTVLDLMDVDRAPYMTGESLLR